MARRKTCIQCGQEFTESKYKIHKFTHLRDQFLRKDPTDVLATGLLPVEVPDEDVIMEDMSQVSAQSTDHVYAVDDPPSNYHETAGDSLQCDDPFSDDHATDDNLSPHGTPFTDSPHPVLPSVLGDEDMVTSPSPRSSGDDSEQSPASIQPSLNEDIGFEDSSLDPASVGLPSLSEQLKERFLRDYHGGGGLCSSKYLCVCSPLAVDSKALI